MTILLKKNLTNTELDNCFEKLSFVEGRIRYCFLNSRAYHELNTTNDVYMFFCDMLGIEKYVIYCRYGKVIKDDLPSAISDILIEGDILNFYSFSSVPYTEFSVKAQYFSLYTLGNVDWNNINILEIVKEIENIEDKPEL
jgi:hypothetical protein